MKKILASILIAGSLVAPTAEAHGSRGGYYGGGNVWVPMIVGGTLGYVISQSQRQPVYVQQPVIVQQPVPSYGYSTPYTTVPPGYHYENILDANCNCFRAVLVPN